MRDQDGKEYVRRDALIRMTRERNRLREDLKIAEWNVSILKTAQDEAIAAHTMDLRNAARNVISVYMAGGNLDNVLDALETAAGLSQQEGT